MTVPVLKTTAGTGGSTRVKNVYTCVTRGFPKIRIRL